MAEFKNAMFSNRSTLLVLINQQLINNMSRLEVRMPYTICRLHKQRTGKLGCSNEFNVFLWRATCPSKQCILLIVSVNTHKNSCEVMPVLCSTAEFYLRNSSLSKLHSSILNYSLFHLNKFITHPDTFQYIVHSRLGYDACIVQDVGRTLTVFSTRELGNQRRSAPH